MVLNNISFAAESPSINSRIVNMNNSELDLPKDLSEEIESFRKRNALVEIEIPIKSSFKVVQCCPQCIKAHAIKLANELGLSKEAFKSIEREFEGEIGHNGYYLDKDKLIKI